MDRPVGYRTPARILHWLIALAVLVMIPAGLIMVRDGIARGLQDALFLLHKNLGVMLIPLVLLRLGWRLTHPAPPFPDTMSARHRRIALLSHRLLYLLLLVMPLSGFVRVRSGGFPIELLDRLGAGPWLPRSEALAAAAQTLHYGAAMAIIALLSLHVSAALYHGLILRDGIWSRIWPIRAPRETPAGQAAPSTDK